MPTKPITPSELAMLEQSARSTTPSRLHSIVLDLIAEIRRIQHLDTERATALAHLDAIISAYTEDDGIMPLVNACRAAKEWRGAELERQKQLLEQWHERV